MIVRNLFKEIMPDIWPMVVIIAVIVSSLRLAYLFKGKRKWSLYNEILGLVFVIYILCLYHVVTFQDINYGVSNFTPFKEIFRYSFGSSKFIKNIIGNITLFIPFGFFSSYYLKNKKMFTPFLLTLIASSTIEIVQYKIGRVFDIDDIILNVIGGVIGYLLYIGFNAIRTRMPKLFRSDIFLNILIIVIIIIIILYSFNFNVFGWLS